MSEPRVSPELVFPDGRRVELDVDIVVGRAPIAPEMAPSARSITVAAGTVSKTHALIGHDDSGVWLVDLHSSNGSEVLDDLGASERADPGRRVAVPDGCHIRIGTNMIITIDSGADVADDDSDRTMVRRPAATPTTPAVAPSPPPPPTPAAPLTQAIPQVAAHSFTPAPQQPPPSYAGAPRSVASAPRSDRSTPHVIGAIILILWGAIGFADLRRWVPDAVVDVADGRLLDFFFMPDQAVLRFLEFFSFVSLPDSLGFLSRGADIGPVLMIAVAISALVVPGRIGRWLLVALVAIPIVLMIGLLVTLAVDSFDFFVDDIDRFIPWFVLPGVGALLLLLPGRRSSNAATPPQNVIYDAGQPPVPPNSGPGAPPF